MKFGVFDHLDDAGVPLGELYANRLRLAEAYDRGGFHAYHLAEHHGTPLGCAPSPAIFLAALAQRTQRLRFGPMVFLLPFYHPLRLIEEICMLDQLSGGRLELDELSFAGEFYRFDGVPMTVRPVQRPHPPLWYGVSFPDSAEWPAANDVNVIALAPPQTVRPIFERYLAVRDKLGKTRSTLLGLGRHVVVAD